MKKVRMIVSAAVVFAVVGSALAFNTAKGNGNLFCNTSGGSNCPTISQYVIDNTQPSNNLWCGRSGSADCAVTDANTKAKFANE